MELTDKDDFLLERAGHGGVALPDEHVDFRADAEAVVVNARLDREAGAGNEAPVVARFVVVHVDAVAVHLFPETVPGAVNEQITISGTVDDVAAGAIDLPATKVCTRRRGGAHELDRSIASGRGGGEGL